VLLEKFLWGPINDPLLLSITLGNSRFKLIMIFKKYLAIIKISLLSVMAYRLSFLMWRIRTIFTFLTIFYFWSSVIPQNNSLFGYSHSQMLTYVFGITIIGIFVFSSSTNSVGEEINDGNLSNFLLKPINYFSYWLTQDLGDKIVNLAFTIIELLILFLLLRPPIFLQKDLVTILLTVFAGLIAAITYFFINMLMGFIAFWNPEIWAPRFIFFVLLGFFAGQYFPLDILPKPVFEFFQLLPFAYLLYFPVKVYLGQLVFGQVVQGFAVGIGWSIVIFFIMIFVWKRGLRSYSAQGR